MEVADTVAYYNAVTIRAVKKIYSWGRCLILADKAGAYQNSANYIVLLNVMLLTLPPNIRYG
jgi:hypothetical protein